jgi:hypothetical protein
MRPGYPNRKENQNKLWSPILNQSHVEGQHRKKPIKEVEKIDPC